jgi:hypothetical protein
MIINDFRPATGRCARTGRARRQARTRIKLLNLPSNPAGSDFIKVYISNAYEESIEID